MESSDPHADPAHLEIDVDAAPDREDVAWERARRAYLAGESAPIVAARLGVSERTLRRRAMRQGWRRTDARAARTSREPAGEFEPDSPLGLFVTATEYEVGELLLDPEPMRYLRYAFRRSAEAAVRGRMAEATGWARLVRLLDQVAPGVSDSARAFNSADHMRAIYAEKLRATFEADENEEKEGVGESGAA